MKFIIGIVIGFLLGAAVLSYAGSTDISGEALWNRVFNSTTNTIKVIGI